MMTSCWSCVLCICLNLYFLTLVGQRIVPSIFVPNCLSFCRGLKKWIKRRLWRSRQNSVNETPKSLASNYDVKSPKTPTSNLDVRSLRTTLNFDVKSPKTPTSTDIKGHNQRSRKMSNSAATNVIKSETSTRMLKLAQSGNFK